MVVFQFVDRKDPGKDNLEKDGSILTPSLRSSPSQQGRKFPWGEPEAEAQTEYSVLEQSAPAAFGESPDSISCFALRQLGLQTCAIMSAFVWALGVQIWDLIHMWQVLLPTVPPSITGDCGEGPSTRPEAAWPQLQQAKLRASEPLFSNHLHWNTRACD